MMGLFSRNERFSRRECLKGMTQECDVYATVVGISAFTFVEVDNHGSCLLLSLALSGNVESNWME